MNNLLVAYDFSKDAEKAIEFAITLAEKFNSHIWLLHVAEPEPDFVGYDAGPPVIRDQIAKKYHEEHKKLQSMADKYRTLHQNITPILIQGPTIKTILSQAGKLNIDLILLGSKGKGKIESLLIGSTSKGVMEKSSKSVMICR